MSEILEKEEPVEEVKKADWIEDVEADMNDEQLKARKEAFAYADSQERRLRQYENNKWKPQDRRVLTRANRAYRRELARIKDERKGNSDMIMTDKVRISLYNGEINNNALILAGSGRGKTYSVVGPNILQANASYVFTDPKGDLTREYGTFLTEEGYKVRTLNFVDMARSNSYNPFRYLSKEHEEDVMTLIETIMKNTDGEKKSGDPFWDKGEQLFVQSVFYYMLYELRKDEQSIPKALEIMRLAEIKEDNDDFISDYDAIMLRLGYELYDVFDGTDEEWEDLVARAESGDEECERLVADYRKAQREQEEYRNNHIAYIQYKHFKAGAGKTAKSIIISAVARLAPFNIKAIRDMSLYDELELDRIGEEKIALFIVMPPTDKTFQFISGMCLTQLFAQLNYCANVKYGTKGAKLPIPVRFILDEFKNTGRIPMFTEILAYARSLNISIMPILQSLDQLKEMYEKEWSVIVDNCAMLLFMAGVKGKDTLEYISWLTGKGTYDKQSYSNSRGMNASTTTQDDKVGVSLITPNKLQEFPKHQCLLFVSGYKVVWDKTYDLSKHPNYKRTAAGGNTPYIPDSEEIKHKREMFKLYLRKINNEDYEVSPKLEFLGKTLEKSFSLYERVRQAIKKDVRTLTIGSADVLANAITMDDFAVYSNREMPDEISNEMVQEVKAKRAKIDKALDELTIHKKSYGLNVLSEQAAIEITKNAIRNENITFLAVNEKLNNIADSIWKKSEDTEDGSSSGSVESSDKEENASRDVREEAGMQVEKSVMGSVERNVTEEDSPHGEEEMLAQMEESAEISAKRQFIESEKEHLQVELQMKEQAWEAQQESAKQVMEEEFSLELLADIDMGNFMRFDMDDILADVDADINADIEEQGDFIAEDIDLD